MLPEGEFFFFQRRFLFFLSYNAFLSFRIYLSSSSILAVRPGLTEMSFLAWVLLAYIKSLIGRLQNSSCILRRPATLNLVFKAVANVGYFAKALLFGSFFYFLLCAAETGSGLLDYWVEYWRTLIPAFSRAGLIFKFDTESFLSRPSSSSLIERL